MDFIVKSVGLSWVLFYVYFCDKEDIYLGLCGWVFEIFF